MILNLLLTNQNNINFMMTYLRRFLLVVGTAIILFSCEDTGNTSRIMVTLTDSPGDYKEVNVQVIGVEVHRQSGEQGSGWISLDMDGQANINLLDLTNGVTALLADAEIPSGQISQIRLILGNENTVVIEGETEDVTYDLGTPSAMQSGLKLQVHETLLSGITYEFKLDFDAAKSVVKAGTSGLYNLKPVIRVITEATSGAIKGSVLPAAENIAVYAMQGEDTIATSYAVENISEFLIGGLEPGTYNVVFDPGENSLLQTHTIEGVMVSIGVIIELNEVTLQE